jgi:hypothetical protein
MGLGCGAIPEAEAVVSGLQDVAVVGEPVEESGGHLGISEDGSPFTEAEIGGDDDAGLLVKLAEQVKQQGTARGAEWQVSQLIEDQQVGVEQAGGDLPGLSGRFLLLEGVDQFDRGEEPYALAVMLDGLDTERGGDVGFSCSRRYSDILLSIRGAW